MKLHLFLSWLCLIFVLALPQQSHGQTWACKGKTGCTTPGDVCPDGTVFGGCPPSSYRPIYTTRCDAGESWSGSTCTNTPLGWAYVSAGDEFTCGVKVDGTMWCWGRDANDELGNGASTTQQNSPVQIGTGFTWKNVQGGWVTACALRTDNTVWCWSLNNNGQVGDNSTTPRSSPVQVNGGGTWKMLGEIAASSEHVCAIRSDDTLRCWGDNFYGQIGDNTSSNDRLVPTAPNGGGTWKYVVTGGHTGSGQTCGIKTDDTLWCWGNNSEGQLGDNSIIQRNIPTSVNGGGTWKMVSIGQLHTCGIKGDKTLWCWGYNLQGQLGDNTTNQRRVPTQVNGGGMWKYVAAGDEHTCGIKTDDSLWCWGYNTEGAVGINTSGNNYLTPQAVAAGARWRTVSADWWGTCGTRIDDTGWCWGHNGSGRVGDGTTGTMRTVPTAITGSAGARVSLAFNNANGTGGTNVAGTLSTTDGATNTSLLVAADSDSGTGGTQPHQSAAYCDSLLAGGYSDWYLPAATEIQTLSVHSAAIGNFGAGGAYWSSTQTGTSPTTAGTYMVETLLLNRNKNLTSFVRCARKD